VSAVWPAAKCSTLKPKAGSAKGKRKCSLKYASLAGAILGGASDEKYQALERYGRAVGEAFQIADDLLDIEGNSAIVGKATQKDETAGKATMAGILGLVGAKGRLEMLVEEAKDALAPFGANASTLVTAARFVAYRNR
jgi:farnesyl diphosphate synthase